MLPDRVRVEGGGESLESMLSTALGRRVHLSLYVSPPRAVRKPVLQLLDDDGRTVAFAKLGLGEFTSALVGDEATALRRLARAGLVGGAAARRAARRARGAASSCWCWPPCRPASRRR